MQEMSLPAVRITLIMTTHTKLFIASSVHKVLAVAFALLGAYLRDLHRPPFDEFGTSCYFISAGLGIAAAVCGIVGLHWQAAADKERRLGMEYDRKRY